MHHLPELVVLEHHVLKLLHVDQAVLVDVELAHDLLGLLQADPEAGGDVLRAQEPGLVLVQAEEKFLGLIEERILLDLRSGILGPLLEEVVALVIYHHKGREVLHVYLPNCLHAQLLHVQDLDVLDALRAQGGRHAADGTQVEAPILLARLGHGGRAVALPDHDHRAAQRLEGADVGVHAPRGGRAEGAGGQARGRLRRAGVVDGVLLDVVGQAFALVDHLLHPGVRDVAGHDDRPREGQARLHGVVAQEFQVFLHGIVKVDLDNLPALLQGALLHIRQVLRRLPLQILEEDALLRDLGLRLPVRGAGDADADRAGGAVPGQPDHPHVVHEVLPSVLGADAGVLRELLDLLLPLQVSERPAPDAAGGGEAVQVLATRQLHRLQRHLGRQAADHEREMVGRACSSAYVRDLLEDKVGERLLVQHGLRLLHKLGLVGAAAPLGDVQEVVLAASLCHHVDLSGQVRLGVCLHKHRLGRNLGVPQVPLGVGLVDASGDVLLIPPVGEHMAATLGHHRRSPGVLARGHDHPGGHAGVLQQLQGHEAVVRGRLGVLEDIGELLEVVRSEEVLYVDNRLRRQAVQNFALHPHKLLPGWQCERGDAVRRQLPVLGVHRRGVVVEELLVLEGRRYGREAAALHGPERRGRGGGPLESVGPAPQARGHRSRGDDRNAATCWCGGWDKQFDLRQAT
mmetsp:Transcript_107968/g.287454  ORF Transcript_107968/g.287454 Transcript_107968/m.287454 type:complete len:685 (+) Transcript_107968:206-2260(+)